MIENFKAYVTKYALTDGIVIVDAEASENSIGMISYKKKIVSLEKSIAKMQSLEIKVRDL